MGCCWWTGAAGPGPEARAALPSLSGAHLLLASPRLIEGADAFLGGKDSPQGTGTAEEAPGRGTLPRQDPGLGFLLRFKLSSLPAEQVSLSIPCPNPSNHMTRVTRGQADLGSLWFHGRSQFRHTGKVAWARPSRGSL